MSLSSNDFSKYTNDIQVHKVKKSNLPLKVTGKHMYFIDNEDGTYSVGVSANDGTIKICSDNTDKLKEQINFLKDYVTKDSSSLKTFPKGKYTCSPNVADLPTNEWWRVTKDIDGNGNEMYQAWSEVLKIIYFGYRPYTESHITWNLPLQYIKIIGVETDWNDIIQSGTYDVHDGKGSHSPFVEFLSLYGYGQLIVSTALYSITQEYTTHSGCVTVKRSGWKQSDGSYSWEQWKRLVTQDEIQSLISRISDLENLHGGI